LRFMGLRFMGLRFMNKAILRRVELIWSVYRLRSLVIILALPLLTMMNSALSIHFQSSGGLQERGSG